MSKAKIILNGAIDMAGPDRGNLRCWEAMGCGGALLSDAGNYPQGMFKSVNMLCYDEPRDAARAAENALEAAEELSRIARAGHDMIKSAYSKAVQWDKFKELA